LQLATEAEYRRTKEIRQKDLSQRDVQLQQLEEWKDRIIAERTADLEEGEFNRKKAKEFEVMSKNRVQEKMDDYKRINAETAKANEALKKIKEMEKQKEHDEEQRIITFARKKEALILERKVGVSSPPSRPTVLETDAPGEDRCRRQQVRSMVLEHETVVERPWLHVRV
jgi:hypothetical protein